MNGWSMYSKTCMRPKYALALRSGDDNEEKEEEKNLSRGDKQVESNPFLLKSFENFCARHYMLSHFGCSG